MNASCSSFITVLFQFNEFQLRAGAVTLAVGGYHTCVVLTDRSVVCWGANGNGQLGTGDSTDRYTPTAVTGLGAGGQARRVQCTCVFCFE